MPRRKQPPRLWLYRRPGRDSTWIILDSGRHIGTGAREADRRQAEEALARYIGGKHVADFGDGHPSRVRIADAMIAYAEKHGPTTQRQPLIGLGVERLVEFFGERRVAAVTPSACADYVAWRTSQPDPRIKYMAARTVKPATARRELVVLAAALRWCWKNGKLDRLIPVQLPPSPQPRDRHLSRSEVAALLWGALGWDRTGQRHRSRINRHLARFILLALYTGTRHDAVLKLQWMPNTMGGWADLENGVLYRRPSGTVETSKRKPPISNTRPTDASPTALETPYGEVRDRMGWKGSPITGQAFMA